MIVLSMNVSSIVCYSLGLYMKHFSKCKYSKLTTRMLFSKLKSTKTRSLYFY